jgi:hypothetical protein
MEAPAAAGATQPTGEYRFLVLEMWVVFVPAARVGILMPGILVSKISPGGDTSFW